MPKFQHSILEQAFEIAELAQLVEVCFGVEVFF
jgi:hypothetical protein